MARRHIHRGIFDLLSRRYKVFAYLLLCNGEPRRAITIGRVCGINSRDVFSYCKTDIDSGVLHHVGRGAFAFDKGWLNKIDGKPYGVCEEEHESLRDRLNWENSLSAVGRNGA